MERINHLAVLVAAIVTFLLGWVWYSLLFKSMWMGYAGVSTMSPSAGLLVVQFVLGWVLAYFVAIAISKAPNPNLTASDGIMFGVFSGIGFFAVPLLLDYVSEGRPVGLWLINAGYIVVSMIVIGVVVTSWKKAAAGAQVSP